MSFRSGFRRAYKYVPISPPSSLMATTLIGALSRRTSSELPRQRNTHNQNGSNPPGQKTNAQHDIRLLQDGKSYNVPLPQSSFKTGIAHYSTRCRRSRPMLLVPEILCNQHSQTPGTILLPSPYRRTPNPTRDLRHLGKAQSLPHRFFPRQTEILHLANRPLRPPAFRPQQQSPSISTLRSTPSR
jgi:hypothetical protein